MRASLETRRRTASPDWVVFLIGAGLAVSLLGDASLYIILPTQYEQAGILAGQVGLMLAANRAIRIVLNNPYGAIIDRIPRRRMLVPSLFLGAVASLLYTVPGFWPLLTGRLLWGAAWAGINLGGTSMILDVATDANRGRLVGRLQMWFFIGVGTSSLLGGLLFDAIGYAPTFVVSAGVILAAALVWMLFLPETRPVRAVREEVDPAEEVPQPNPFRTGVHPSSPTAPLVMAIAIHGLNWLVFIGMAITLLPVLLEERMGLEIAIAGLLTVQLVSFTGMLSAFNTVISMVSSPLSGWLSDRSGNRWSLVIGVLMIGAVSLSVMVVFDGTVMILATMFNAVATGVLTTQLIALVGDYTGTNGANGRRQGRTLGVMNTVGDIGGTIGPVLAYAMLPEIGLEGVFTVCALALIMALPGAIWVGISEKTR